MTSACLVLTDIDRIKSFIFAAPHLREIRGSSGILAALNDPYEVHQRVKAQGTLLYAGGGSVLAAFPSILSAQDFIERETRELEERTQGGATLTGVYEPIGTASFRAAMLRAQASLHDAKARRAALMRRPHSFFFKPCQSCGTQPAQQFHPLRQQFVCSPCAVHIQYGGEMHPMYRQFVASLDEAGKEHWQAPQLADDLTALAATTQNTIGVIRADGNAMGERLKCLAELGSEDLFTQFSKACREATEEAVLAALRKAYQRPRWFADHTIFPFEFVLLGGDDVELITTADQALQVAMDLCNDFTKRMQRFADACSRPELAVAMSAGVVCAQSTYPIAALDDLAEQLLKSAKASSRRRTNGSSLMPTMDFMIVTASITGNLETVRTQEYRCTQQQHLTQRPYEIAQLSTLFDHIRLMKYPPVGVAPFPRNKLQALYDLFFPFRSKRQTALEYLLLTRRLSDQGTLSHREMLRRLNEQAGVDDMGHSPWRASLDPKFESDTCLVDMVELYDFVPRRSE
jgi:hypothetical protein